MEATYGAVLSAAAAGSATSAWRVAVAATHPRLAEPWRGPPASCCDAAAAALCLCELLATQHDAPLLGAAPEAMLSC